MALTVRDIMELQCMRHLELVAGESGLDNVVTSAGVVDWEFSDGVDEKYRDYSFREGEFDLSSLLFAKDDPDKILSATQFLFDIKASAFAYKSVLYNELPEEVIAYANKHGFPIFKFGTDIFIENIIFEVMDAIEAEDTHYLTENSISKMIQNGLPKSEVYSIGNSLSFGLKSFSMAVYVKPISEDKSLDLERVFRNFRLNKRLKKKAIICRYQGGLFIIVTMEENDPEKYKIIVNEVLSSTSISLDTVRVAYSNIHPSYSELDSCLRESHNTYKVMLCYNHQKYDFNKLGIYQILANNRFDDIAVPYCQRFLDPILSNAELMETSLAFEKNRGDINNTANELICHPNTVRYRLSRIKASTEYEGCSELDFYVHLTTAIKIYRLINL